MERFLLILSLLLSIIQGHGRELKKRDGGRTLSVLVWLDLDEQNFGVEPAIVDGEANLAAYTRFHSALQIQGDGIINGNLRVQIRYEFDEVHGPLFYFLEAVEKSPSSSDSTLPKSYSDDTRIRRAITLDQKIDVSNAELIGPDGTGKIADVWAQNPSYKTGVNDCNVFVRNMLQKLGASLPEDIDDIFANKLPDAAARGLVIEREVVPLIHKVQKGFGDYVEDRKDFIVDKIDASGNVRVTLTNEQFESELSERLTALQITKVGNTFKSLPGANYAGGIMFGGVSDVPDPPNPFGQYDLVPDTGTGAGIGDAPNDGSSAGEQPDDDFKNLACFGKKRAATDCGSSTQKLLSSDATDLTLARTDGKFQVITSFAEDVLRASGVAGLIGAASLVILDFSGGRYLAASLDLVSLTLATVSLFVAPPLIPITLGLSLLFAILPGIFEAKDPPKSNSPTTQIIQWTFFGDTGHTGNEQCNKQRASQHLSQNCTVVYGPGVISRMFQWEMFDAISFLIAFNQGHSMSIPDIVAVFNVTDHTSTSGNTAPAMIDCGEAHDPANMIPNRYIPDPKPGAILPSSKGYECSNPTYKLDRTKINLPVLNTTVAAIHSRIIPQPNGDCKLIADPINGIKLALWNVTLTGRPVAIACNLTADAFGYVLSPFGVASNSSANLTALSAASNSSANSTSYPPPQRSASLISHPNNVTVASSGNTETDSSSGRAYISPPQPAVPFASLNATNSVCLTGTNQNLCLPNGTFTTQQGDWGFSTRYVTGIVMPASSSLNFSVPVEVDEPTCMSCLLNSEYGLTTMRTHIYNQNITDAKSASSKNLSTSLSYITTASGPGYYKPLTISTPPQLIPPSICLFSQPQYQGETTCLGVGGGNLSSAFSGKAQSLRCVGGASAWMYSQYYGDLGAAFVSTDVGDLQQVPYGNKESFSNNIRALWIQKPVS